MPAEEIQNKESQPKETDTIMTQLLELSNKIKEGQAENRNQIQKLHGEIQKKKSRRNQGEE